MLDVINGFLEAAIRTSTPILLASLGAVFTARSGIINFAMEGIMIMGAFFGVYGSYLTGNPWVGALMGMGAGLAAAMVLGVLSIDFKVNQVVAGAGINALFLGLTSYLFNVFYTIKPASVPGFHSIALFPENVTGIPIAGMLLDQQLLTYLAFLLVPVIWYIMNRTSFGLCLRAAGEQPHAADSLGINVRKMRYIAIVISGLLGGLGGVALSLGQLSVFMESMTAGRGYLAWSAVTVGKWNPVGIMGASLLFGGASALQVRLQAMGLNVPHQFFAMLPYLLTMIVLAGVVGRTVSPASMGKPFIKGER